MNRITKVLSSLVAAVTLAVSVGSVASAATYDPCDVNYDGVVNIRDSAAVKKYLEGNLYEENYNRFDADNNFIVDNNDIECIKAKISGLSYSNLYFSQSNQTYSSAPPTTQYIADDSAESTVGRVYMRYSYAEQKQLQNYSLFPSTATINNTTNTKGILRAPQGTDDRYKTNSILNTGIVYISLGGTCGTGFIVGDHQIATNAHVVYDKNSQKWNNTAEIYTYNSNGERTTKRLTAVEAHIPVSYKSNSNGKYDYALVTVKEDLSNYFQFNLGSSYNVNKTLYSDIPIYVTGCGGKNPDDSINETRQLWTGEGKITRDNNKSQLYYDSDTRPGNSGSPVYTISKTRINGKQAFVYTAIGIHHGGATNSYNCGPTITKYLLQFFLSNSNINY